MARNDEDIFHSTENELRCLSPLHRPPLQDHKMLYGENSLIYDELFSFKLHQVG